MIYKNNEQLQRDCKGWQEVLRLQDWDIEASIERGHSLGMEDRQATVSWNLPKRMAVVRVLDPVDYPPGSMEEQDMEVSLVHELLHLHYAPFDETEAGSLAEIAVEQSIEAISRALVSLKRKGV